MEEVIERVIKDQLAAIPEKKFRCTINIFDRSVSGTYTYGLLNKKTGDLGDLDLIDDARDSKFDLVDELSSEIDKNGLSPYGMELKFDQSGKYDYKIKYPNLNFSDLSEVEKGPSGILPEYIYINITENLISKLDVFSINQVIPSHVEEVRKILKFDSDVEYTKSISTEFYLLMLNIRVEGDIDSGRFDYLYNLFSESGSEIIVDIYNSFHLLGNNDWSGIIKESIQLYSHFYGNVEQARIQLGIEPIEKQVESDIMDRYYKVQPELNEIRREYIKSNPRKFIKVIVSS